MPSASRGAPGVDKMPPRPRMLILARTSCTAVMFNGELTGKDSALKTAFAMCGYSASSARGVAGSFSKYTESVFFAASCLIRTYNVCYTCVPGDSAATHIVIYVCGCYRNNYCVSARLSPQHLLQILAHLEPVIMPVDLGDAQHVPRHWSMHSDQNASRHMGGCLLGWVAELQLVEVLAYDFARKLRRVFGFAPHCPSPERLPGFEILVAPSKQRHRGIAGA